MKTIEMLDRKIGLNHPTYFVADIAANHDGDFGRAKELIHLAAEAGADAAKFQNFRAETIVSDVGFRTIGHKQTHQSKWNKDVYQVYDAAALPMEWTKELKETCDDAGIHYFTAPYEIEMIDTLSQYVCAWKVGSGDITWIEHIDAMSRDGKPIMLATGASNMEDVRRAVDQILENNHDLVLMQCNTNYTASLENFRYIALNVLKLYAKEYPNVVLGLSDHTPGHVTVLGAVALGARVIEKHFTDDITREGPDHLFSMDYKTWKDMVDATKHLEVALGTEDKMIMDNEKETVVVQRRAIRAKRLIHAGEIIDKKSIIPLRPCPNDGLSPNSQTKLIGKRAINDIQLGECVRLEDVC